MRRGRGGWTKTRLLLALVGGLALLFVLAQVLLPRIAASRISSRVGRYGKVRSVSVSAWPALELLWGHADSVRVSASSLALSTAQLGGLLWEGRGASSLQVSADSVRLGTLTVSDASLAKHGSSLSAHALVSEADIKAALPPGFGVRLLRSESGEVEVQASGGLFGVGASVNAVAGASEGKLVAHPLGFLLEGLRLTLFADPHVYVEGVGASVASEQPLTYRLTMSARLL
jgi:LmeA-like phospholipid-binding